MPRTHVLQSVVPYEVYYAPLWISTRLSLRIIERSSREMNNFRCTAWGMREKNVQLYALCNSMREVFKHNLDHRIIFICFISKSITSRSQHITVAMSDNDAEEIENGKCNPKNTQARIFHLCPWNTRLSNMVGRLEDFGESNLLSQESFEKIQYLFSLLFIFFF